MYYIDQHHLLLLSWKDDTHFTLPQRVESQVNQKDVATKNETLFLIHSPTVWRFSGIFQLFLHFSHYIMFWTHPLIRGFLISVSHSDKRIY